MSTYRLMDGAGSPTRPGSGPSASTGYSGNFLGGVLFSVTGEMCWLDGYYWWVCNTGQATGPQKFALWNRYSTTSTSQSVVSGSVVTSGTLTAGAWNYIPLSTPIQLAPGGLYVAATGWVTSAGGTLSPGFPDTHNQFVTNGISNGPLTAWSDLGGSDLWEDGSAGNNSMDQGLFSTVGSDPSVNCPNGGSNSANFWMDVLVDTSPPSGYSGSYRVWPNRIDLGNYTNDTANGFTLGMEFSLTQACTVNNVWFYSPSGVTQLPTEIGIYQVSSTTLVASNASPSWSGAAGSGWVSAPLTASLSASTNYKVVVLNGAGSPSVWNAAVANYWSTGFGSSGLVSGPITVPDNAAATSPGQGSYNAGSTIAYPNTNAGPFNYGVDIEVTPAAAAAAPPPGAQLIPPGIVSPMAFQRQAWPAPAPLLVAGADSGTGADSGSATATVSGADTGTGADGGTLTASAAASDAGSGADAGTVAATASGADTSSGADSGAASVSAADADTGTAAEAAAVTVSSTDTGSGDDSGYSLVPVSAADAGAGADSGSVTAAAVADTDTGQGADSAAVTASAAGADSGHGTDSASAYQPAVLPPAAQLGGSAASANTYGGSAVNANDYGGSAE